MTNLSDPPKGIVRFYNGRGTEEQWIKEGKHALNCPDLSGLPQVRGQSGEAMAVRPRLQLHSELRPDVGSLDEIGPAESTGQLHEKAGVAGGYEALDSDQSSDQADQDGWATGPPCQKAGVSVPTPSRILDEIGTCRGAGGQGNADRDTRTDQPASAGTWLADGGDR